MNTENPWKRDPSNFDESHRKDFEQGSMGDVDRNYGQYQFFLGVDFKNMEGKKILDIGGGVTGKMPREVAEKFGVEVVSMSPEYVSKADESEGKFIFGRAQEIPFKDNTFDYELALYSIPMYLPPIISEYEKCLQEIVRTLKDGGKAHIFPIKAWPNGDLDELFSKALESINSSATYEHEYVRSSKGVNHRVILTKKI